MVRKWKWRMAQRDHSCCITDAFLLHPCTATVASTENLVAPLTSASSACPLVLQSLTAESLRGCRERKQQKVEVSLKPQTETADFFPSHFFLPQATFAIFSQTDHRKVRTRLQRKHCAITSSSLKHGCPAISALSVMKQELATAVCSPTEHFVDLCGGKEMGLQWDAALAALSAPASPGLTVLPVPPSCYGAWCFNCSCSKRGQKSTLQPFISLTNPLLMKSFIIVSAVVEQSLISSSCCVYLYAFNSSCFSPERSQCVCKNPSQPLEQIKTSKTPYMGRRVTPHVLLCTRMVSSFAEC